MSITQEYKTQIEEITCGIDCPKGAQCLESGLENLCRIKYFGAKLFECCEENAQSCKFSIHYGFGYFCKCPLRMYIAKNFYK